MEMTGRAGKPSENRPTLLETKFGMGKSLLESLNITPDWHFFKSNIGTKRNTNF
jgi:hypothetical protein